MEAQPRNQQPAAPVAGTHDMSHHVNDNSQETQHDGHDGSANWAPRPKRVACVVCRKRKLKCDGQKPHCGSCARLGHDCAYSEVRKKSGPKRGYVKQLEARLAQVETLLKAQEPGDNPSLPAARKSPAEDNNVLPFPDTSLPDGGHLPDIPPTIDLDAFAAPSLDDSNSNFPWEMIGLGLEEPLPSQEVIDELNEIYFQKIHPSVPSIHRPRYYASMNFAPAARPPICLRYSMWTHAAQVSEKYQSLHPHFYQRARKYAEMDEMKGLGENMITVAHCQAWNLIAMYEFKMMFFPRAWMSSGKASRLAQMLGLHRLDGSGLDVKQCLPPPRDWTEQEERRRTFWVAFCQDRYASVGTGWPMITDETDIMTNLPSSEHAYVNCKTQQSPSLAEVLAGNGTSSLSSYGAVVLLACLFGRNLHHLHRTTPKDRDHDLNGEFWKRHRALDNIILGTSLSLPTHLRLPDGINDPCVVFTNMSLHTSTICLHQAAIFTAEKNSLPAQIAAESKRRCIIAADQIANIMKMISHTDLSAVNPFLAFCLYVACRIFTQYLKSRPEDQPVLSSLQFLLAALNILRRKNPLTESFLAQLDFDLEGLGLEVPGSATRFTGEQFNEIKRRCMAILPDADDGQPSQPQMPTTAASTSTFPSPLVCQGLPTRERPPPKQPSPNISAQRGDEKRNVPGMGVMSNAFYTDMDQDRIRSIVMELDGSTEVSNGSERHNSTSDHPTPSTNKSTTNTSYSPQSNNNGISPPQQQQQQQQQHRLDPKIYSGSTATTSPSSYFDSSPSNANNASTAKPFNYFSTDSNFPVNTVSIAVESPFGLQSAWTLDPPQTAQGVAVADGDLTNSNDPNLPSLDDATWPTPGGMDWNNWVNQ